MVKIFALIIDMSLTASYCILFVCLARTVLKIAPKIYSYLLWLIVAFRLVCPVSFESPFSFLQLNVPEIMTNITDDTAINENGASGSHSKDVYLQTENTITGKPLISMQLVMKAGSFIWITGSCILISISFISYSRLKKKLLKNAHLTQIYKNKILIWEAERLETPFVLGFFNPEIYLPAGLSTQEKTYCLSHEVTHITRKDHLTKQFAYLLACVYWFNPFVWLALHLMTYDMEMACDEAVIRELDIQDKKQYSRTLLALATNRRFQLAANSLAFGENSVGRRIKNIMNYKKPGFWITIICVVAVVALAVGLVANPKHTSSSQPSGTNEAQQISSVQQESQQPENTDQQESSQQSEKSAIVNTDSLRVRALPSDDAEIIGLLSRGETVDIISAEDTDKYATILFKNEDGEEVEAFVQVQYLDIFS